VKTAEPLSGQRRELAQRLDPHSLTSTDATLWKEKPLWKDCDSGISSALKHPGTLSTLQLPVTLMIGGVLGQFVQGSLRSIELTAFSVYLFEISGKF
jgi:hypothetical protein